MHQREIDIRRRIFGDESGIQGIDMAGLARVYARKREFPMADSLFRAALANRRRYVPDTHYDVRTIFGFMSERYRLEGKPAEAERYARLAQPRETAHEQVSARTGAVHTQTALASSMPGR